MDSLGVGVKIYFYWDESSGGRRPGCRSGVLNGDGVDLLACLLMDDGGQPYLETIPWLDEGLYKISQISSGQAEMADWGRDAWSVALAGKVARIYSLYDETYFSDMTLEDFAGAMLGWKKFILSQ
ncbi:MULTISPECIES: hypothetical protein [Pseudomonas]|jgi:hypothetical protein|nr:hypothetical protein [Pseudomonas protegens]MBP5107547.1 hypothetical protein [Pseudomonas protegens]MBP5127084.1 hypothetical protein [Pseudomonas protegens]MBP5133559.1 hypothetical protein [Pseudomonas protegens]MBP5150981.1 hypothetical protein [Pseudomonas protegens]UVL74231.1 hypothetical protein LOY23_08315 [Pseudomonas protegens]